jgi:uncharacterized coiled-coil DUF342 family protein
MRYLLVLALTLLAANLAEAQRRGQPIDFVVLIPDSSIPVEELQNRIDDIESLLNEWPSDTAAMRTGTWRSMDEKEFDIWSKSVQSRLKTYSEKIRFFLNEKSSNHAEMVALVRELDDMRRAFDTESKRFQHVSNILTTRHDSLKNAVANIR